jgi:hypothetical protein
MTKGISIDKIKKLKPKTFFRIIDRIKKSIKKDPIIIDMFKDYDVDLDELDLYPMYFKDLDVSAKTDHGIIYFNYALLCSNDLTKINSYAIHEVTHVLQQTTGDKATKSSDSGDYLSNPYEEEGFQNQIEYIANEHGEDKAEEYVDDLLDHHGVSSKREMKKKKDKLMANV